MDIKQKLLLHVCDPESAEARLMAEARVRIVELEEYDRDGEIAGLKRDYKDLHRKFVQQTQELALAQDRSLYLEGRLIDAHMAGQIDAGVDPGFSNAQIYVAQLEADNEQN